MPSNKLFHNHKSWLKPLLFVLFIISSMLHPAVAATRVKNTTKTKLHKELPIFDLTVGSPILIRTFKKESKLELWVKKKNSEQFKLFRTYPICYFSGSLGPKQRKGDKMTPEGYYYINKRSLNPNSRFHLSMNINYPNRYDRQIGRTGSLIMIHGACDAVGCFAMSNSQIEEIYYLAEQALRHGQKNIPVHAFPFHLTPKNLAQYKNHKWYGFWQQLAAGYQLFNQTQKNFNIDVEKKRYVVSEK